ncbi:substrate-binding periplasmic protein [Dongia sp.]|uniref:substrate-binding periplasmic protein n=1 Tax=Dongia sp. TaxID=1977262 RepID=UPI0035AF84B8
MKRFLAALLILLIGAASESAAQQKVTLVAENDWFPYAAERHGAPEGMAVDLVRAAYAAAGVELDLVSLPYARCLEEVAKGVRLGCFDTIREPETLARFLFHKEPLFSARIVIIAPIDATVENLTAADLKGQTVAVTNGYTYGEPFQSDATIKKDVAKNDLAILRLVANQRDPYGVIYDKVMAHLLAEHGGELAGKVKVVGLLTEPDLYVSFSKERPDAQAAMAALDKGLGIIRANGTYAEIEERWSLRFSVAAP